MSIATAIQAAQNKVTNAYTAVLSKGGTLPATQNLSNLPTAINSIPASGGSVAVASYVVTNGTATRLSGSLLELDGIINIGTFGMSWAYYSCDELDGSVVFTDLESIGYGGLQGTFSGCALIKTVSFPSLTTVDTEAFWGGISSSGRTFHGCSQLTAIHFPAAVESQIRATNGFSAKWGATSATIYFDL